MKNANYDFDLSTGFAKKLLDKSMEELNGEQTFMFGSDNGFFITTDENICKILQAKDFAPLQEESFLKLADTCQNIASIEQFSTFFDKSPVSPELSPLTANPDHCVDLNTIIASRDPQELLKSLETVLEYQHHLPDTLNKYPFISGFTIELSAYDMGGLEPCCGAFGFAPSKFVLQDTIRNIKEDIDFLKNQRALYDELANTANSNNNNSTPPAIEHHYY